ncbi:ciliary neurotrophic factor isoform X2 [Hemicordylus capensis]|uniref:ciliary neurotrophic factor isoform X2 n=1 Tax=Hemicordylus capensis TaxID=884348 RepID=UPI002304ABA5|nr:ciliary neurotrophic factor isoform X2 [Hemicordylus capensis]
MALAERPPGTSHHGELCGRTIHLLRKMRSDVGSLLETYIEKQGLDKNFNLDSIDGVPTASTEQWTEKSDAERLGDNLKAYWAFKTLLNEILQEQKADLTPMDGAFHESIQSVMIQVSALAYQLEELIVTLEHSVPDRQLDCTSNTGEKGLFEKKIRGMKVLQELAHWIVRSVRDLHQISKSVQMDTVSHASCPLAQVQKK